MVAGPLAAVPTEDLFQYLKDYLQRENVCGLLIGYSAHKDGSPVEHEKQIMALIEKISVLKPEIALYRLDEKYTSRLAQRALLQAGARKKDRRLKENTDVMSAILLLQEYLQFYKQT
jgi:putative Holliday junction resolvase